MIQLKPIQEIQTLLSNSLLTSADAIEDAYRWLHDYFAFQYQLKKDYKESNVLMDKSMLSSSFDMIKNNPVRTIGIDFPVLLSKGDNRPTMMICAMDPLRHDTVDKNPSHEIQYWVPFSIINNPDKKTKHSEKENLAFFHTLLNTYDLYVTDIYKLFYRHENKVSNSIKAFKALPAHRTILDAEIQIVQPSAILTLGNNAKDAICNLFGLAKPGWTDEINKTKTRSGIEVVMVPHISGAANGTKAPILNNPAYADVSGKNSERYAEIILKALKQ